MAKGLPVVDKRNTQLRHAFDEESFISEEAYDLDVQGWEARGRWLIISGLAFKYQTLSRIDRPGIFWGPRCQEQSPIQKRWI